MSNSAQHPDGALFDQSAAAKFLNVSPKTLEKWRWSGCGPKFLRLSGRVIRYRISDLNEFLSQCERRSTSESGGQL